MNAAGITDKLFRFADVLVGRLHGGLGQVNIFASLIFSGISGAALADVGGLGRIEIRHRVVAPLEHPVAVVDAPFVALRA